MPKFFKGPLFFLSVLRYSNCVSSLFQYLDTLDLSPVFTIEEFKHWFIPRKGIVDSYVVEVSYYLFLLRFK